MPGQQGMQKRCRLSYDRLLISFENLLGSEMKVEEVSMPVGLYTLANPSGTCGLANRDRMIGFVDIPQSFYDPSRASAQILWMADGFVEYVFPCTLPATAEISLARPSAAATWLQGHAVPRPTTLPFSSPISAVVLD